MFPALTAMSRLLPGGSPAFYTASRLILFLWDRINNKKNALQHSLYLLLRKR